jgi:hypothetical protein
MNEFARSKGIPSTILGMASPRKQAAVNLVLGGNAVITGKPNGEENIETMTFEVDIIVLGRDCAVSPSGSHVRS